MKRIFVPTTGPADWKPLLAKPDLHWKRGYSAMSVANSWEAAADKLPPEIQTLLATGPREAFADVRLLVALPEFTVPLPGGKNATQTDVFAIARSSAGLLTIAVEGKVDEPFGSTVEQKRKSGGEERLAYLHDLLQLSPSSSGALRYQLFHRTAAAVLLARDFNATAAVMVVQSFSPEHRWFDDFYNFGRALGVELSRGSLGSVGVRGGVPLYIGWTSGDQTFRGDVS
jgi:hypothetical protein